MNKTKNIKPKSSTKKTRSKSKKVDIKKEPEVVALLKFFEKYAPAHSTNIFKVDKAGHAVALHDRYANLARSVLSICEDGSLPSLADVITDGDKTLSLATILQWLYFNVKPFPFDIWEVRGLFQKIIKTYTTDLRQGKAKLKFAKNYSGTSLSLYKWLSNTPGTGSNNDYWFRYFKYYLPGFVIPPNYGK